MPTLWIQTRDGHAIDLIKPDLFQIPIEEVAHSLARINRYTGHTDTQFGYSVAQHSVLVAWHLPPRLQRAGLMHDAHESFIGDISSPVKWALEELGGGAALHELDERAMAAVEKRWPVGPLDEWDRWAIKQADLQALITERRDFLGDRQAKPWGIDIDPWPDVLYEWTAREAEGVFMREFYKMGGVR